MPSRSSRLRVALVVGTLGQGGAEKQLVFIARALCEADVDVRVYCLTRDEHYEPALQSRGLQPIWFGQHSSPVARLARLVSLLRQFRPHIIQSTHDFTNLYASLAGRLLRVISLGALRSSLRSSSAVNGHWHRWLIQTPTALLPNSQAAAREVLAGKLLDPLRVYLLPNVIDLSSFDRNDVLQSDTGLDPQRVNVMFVARLVDFKRLDRFLRALAVVREREPRLNGIIVGDGPERARMEQLAVEVGVLPGTAIFLGKRNDVPALLRRGNIFALTSDSDEGSPNVLLEAMAASLPVITTPAGDAAGVVEHGVTGYVVPFDDIDGIAEHMICLSQSLERCRKLGTAGRRRVEQLYSYERLSDRLLLIYRSIAERNGQLSMLQALAEWALSAKS